MVLERLTMTRMETKGRRLRFSPARSFTWLSCGKTIEPIIRSKLLMHLRDRGALSRERKPFLSCERVLVNLLNPLDPDAVVADVEIVQDVRGLVLPEDLVDVQQALQDAGLPWAEEHTRGMEKPCYFCSVLGLTPRCSCRRARRASEGSQSLFHR